MLKDNIDLPEESDEDFAAHMAELDAIVHPSVCAVSEAELVRARVAVRQIEQVGLSRDNYDAVKQVIPTFLPDVDRKRLTVNPSATYRVVAMEALSETSMKMIAGLAAGVAAGGIGYLFFKMVEWMRSRMRGSMSGTVSGGTILKNNKGETLDLRVPKITISLKESDKILHGSINHQIEILNKQVEEALKEAKEYEAKFADRAKAALKERTEAGLLFNKIVDKLRRQEDKDVVIDRRPTGWDSVTRSKDTIAWTILARTVNMADADLKTRVDMFFETMAAYDKGASMPYARNYLTTEVTNRITSSFLYEYDKPFNMAKELVTKITEAIVVLVKTVERTPVVNPKKAITNDPHVLSATYEKNKKDFGPALAALAKAEAAAKLFESDTAYKKIMEGSTYEPHGNLTPGICTFIPNKYSQLFASKYHFVNPTSYPQLRSKFTSMLGIVLTKMVDAPYLKAIGTLEHGFKVENLEQLDEHVSDPETLKALKASLSVLRGGVTESVKFHRMLLQHATILDNFATTTARVANTKPTFFKE